MIVYMFGHGNSNKVVFRVGNPLLAKRLLVTNIVSPSLPSVESARRLTSTPGVYEGGTEPVL